MPKSERDDVRCLALFTELVNPNRKGGILVFNQFLVRALGINHVRSESITEFDRREDREFENGRVIAARPGRLGRVLMAVKAMVAALRWRPDFVLCGHIAYSPIAVMLKWLLRRPIVVICHGTEAWALGNRRRFVAKADVILAVSRFTRDAVARQIPELRSGSIRVLPNTYDDERFTPLPRPTDLLEKHRLDPSDRIILTVCRLDPSEGSKGYDSIISALTELRTQFPNVRYVLVGRGRDAERVQRNVDKMGLSKIVRLAGFVSDADLPRYYALCDLFAMPSNQEGFGIVFLEALGCGRPVLAGNRDGGAEPLLDGKLGMLVDPADIHAIEKAIASVLSREGPPHFYDPEALHSMAKRHFGRDRFASRLAEVLADVLGGARTGANGRSQRCHQEPEQTVPVHIA